MPRIFPTAATIRLSPPGGVIVEEGECSLVFAEVTVKWGPETAYVVRTCRPCPPGRTPPGHEAPLGQIAGQQREEAR